jgi:diacylglycerol kinase (ATP)
LIEIMPGIVRQSDCLVVVNPSAAAVDASVACEIEGWLSERARTVRTAWTQAPGHAAELVRAHADTRLIVAVGGDGTVSELVQAMTGHQIVCALPVGSGNSTARNLFGERGWRQVLDLLDDPGAFTVRKLDLLRLVEPGVTAVLGASTGFLAQVLRDARAVDPAVTGIDRYYVSAAGILQAMPDHPTRVTVDGVVLADGPLSSVAIGGGRFRAWSFQFLPESLLDDGMLDVSTIDALNPAAVVELAQLIATGQHLGRPDVRYARGTSVIVERTDGLPLVAEFDGSVWDAASSRLTIEIVPDGLLALAATDGPCS